MTRKVDVLELESEGYIGTLTLHCALLTTAKLHAGINKKVGLAFHKRVFGDEPLSKLTIYSTIYRISLYCIVSP
jgi:hypothetical protein